MNNQMTPLNILNKFTVAILLLAIVPLPYSYYMFLRWAILFSSGIHLYFAVNQKKIFVIGIFVALGMLFNPIIPVHLAKGAWLIINLLSALFVAIGFANLNKVPLPSDTTK